MLAKVFHPDPGNRPTSVGWTSMSTPQDLTQRNPPDDGLADVKEDFNSRGEGGDLKTEAVVDIALDALNKPESPDRGQSLRPQTHFFYGEWREHLRMAQGRMGFRGRRA